MRRTPFIAAVVLAAVVGSRALAAGQVVRVFEDEAIHWVQELPDIKDADGFAVRHTGQIVERTLELPPAPASPGDARRIIATVSVHPVIDTTDGQPRPNDPWTRLGNVSVVVPGADGRPTETELVRFTTGYGAPGRFEQDVTPFAPLLHGTVTLRGFVHSYSEKPGWTISLSLRYTSEGIGQRRPAFARQLFNDMHVTTGRPALSTTVEIPAGLDRPRLRITSTGHATDGLAGNEFLTCTHVLRVDGREVARWRPWSEEGGVLRELNPWAGRQVIDDRVLRASDFDRTGWHPGQVVTPLVFPAPELTPGPHRVEIEIIGIRPKDPPVPPLGKEHHGYWFVTAAVVADEPWPEE